MNVSEIVTDRIIAELEKGNIPWQRPWSTGTSAAISRASGKRYMLLNQMLLGAGEYLTFEECKRLGGKVKKGEHGQFCVSWARIKTTKQFVEEDGTITEKEAIIPRLRYYYVFEVSQCEGIERLYTYEPEKYDTTPNERAEKIIKDYITRENIDFTNSDGNKAYYQPSTDSVVVPAIDRFKNVEEYYSTSFHELTHSTMKASRCNRVQERKGKSVAFGSEEYSKEELVAELGASALVNYAGLESEKSFRNSTAYIQSWIKALKNDKNLIVSASSKAEKAVNYILGVEA